MLRRRIHALAILVLAACAAAGPVRSGEQTVGLFLNAPGSFDGYTLFESLFYTDTYLINNEGRLVHSWQSAYIPGNMAYLREDGHLVRAADPGGMGGPFDGPGGAGMAQEFDWDSNLLWEFLYSNDDHRAHHDIDPLPNGNVLIIAWEYKSEAEAIAAGRNTALIWDGELWPEHVIEVEPVGATGGNIVWEWHAWDHLIQDFDPSKANFGVVADHPELMNLNFAISGRKDWLHANAVDYNEDLDQIVISFRHISEFWIIDHSTTTAEAAGHTGGVRGMGGDILYRWGNPRAYDRGTAADQQLHRPHDAQWIDPELPGEGNVLIFNNGQFRPEGTYSTVDEVVTTVDSNGDYPVPAAGVPHGPAAPTWIYTATPPESLFSSFVSGAQRQPNGNTLICEGAGGTFLEVDLAEEIVWHYVCPVNSGGPMMQGDVIFQNTAFRVHRYAPEFPAFDGRDLTPGGPIEIYSTTGVVTSLERRPFTLSQNYPNPFHPSTTIAFSLRDPASVALEIHDIGGRRVATLVSGYLGVGEHRYAWRANHLPSGVYHYTLRVGAEVSSRRMVLLR